MRTAHARLPLALVFRACVRQRKETEGGEQVLLILYRLCMQYHTEFDKMAGTSLRELGNWPPAARRKSRGVDSSNLRFNLRPSPVLKSCTL